jgi:bifunctional non-homologous end joining protein LigD
MPIDWKDLTRVKSGDAWTLANALHWIKRRRSDPWADIDDIRQSLPKP